MLSQLGGPDTGEMSFLEESTPKVEETHKGTLLEGHFFAGSSYLKKTQGKAQRTLIS